MRIGVVTEIKPSERRVGVTPAGAAALIADGHELGVQRGAGVGAGYPDAAYERHGARVVETAEELWSSSELVVKVKEPIAEEHRFLHDELVLFTYLHLAADRPLAEALVAAGTTAIAYETVLDGRGGLPLLVPMSEVAGRLAAQAAAQHLQHPFDGPGILIGGVPGVRPARVTVIGGGVAGTQTAIIAAGMQADVTVLDTSPARIRELEALLGGRVRVLASDAETLSEALSTADVVVGAVLIPGAVAPHVVTRATLAQLSPEALLIDIAIDQGGCFESSRPTTHEQPTFRVDGILHYCVANMPGAVPRTSTRALTNATLPYVRRLAADGPQAALADPLFAAGLTVSDGAIRHPQVAAALPGLPALPQPPALPTAA